MAGCRESYWTDRCRESCRGSRVQGILQRVEGCRESCRVGRSRKPCRDCRAQESCNGATMSGILPMVENAGSSVWQGRGILQVGRYWKICRDINRL